jgi:oligopeptide transport system substrate-binding protein
MEGLVGLDGPAMKIVPELAKSWTKSADGRTYTFYLREGVKWSDGVPLKAQDFVYSWKRLLSPVTGSTYAYMLFDVEGAENFNKGTITDFNSVGVKALDDRTLQVRLSRPVAYWLHIPTFWVTFPLRQDIVEKYGNSWAKPGRMVTVGPFNLFLHDLDSKVVLKPNPHYYRKKGNVEQVVGLIVRDDSTAFTLYESGKLDFVTDIPTVDMKRLAGRSDLKTFPYLKTAYLGFAVGNFPASNVHLRRAISMAVDKTKILQLLHGVQQVASSFVPPGVMAHSSGVGLGYDPVNAKREYRLAGLDSSRPLKIQVLVNNLEKSVTIAQFLQAELKRNLGIELELQLLDHKIFWKQLELRTYPMFIAHWSADYPDPDNYLSVFLSSSGNNRVEFKDSAFDDRVLEARTLSDSRARERAYVEAQKKLIETEAVILPLYYEPNIALVKKRVLGLELNPLNYLYLRKVELP